MALANSCLSRIGTSGMARFLAEPPRCSGVAQSTDERGRWFQTHLRFVMSRRTVRILAWQPSPFPHSWCGGSCPMRVNDHLRVDIQTCQCFETDPHPGPSWNALVLIRTPTAQSDVIESVRVRVIGHPRFLWPVQLVVDGGKPKLLVEGMATGATFPKAMERLSIPNPERLVRPADQGRHQLAHDQVFACALNTDRRFRCRIHQNP